MLGNILIFSFQFSVHGLDFEWSALNDCQTVRKIQRSNVSYVIMEKTQNK